jgi:HK97 family phage portal protein
MGFFSSNLFGRNTSNDVRVSDPYLAEFFSGRGITNGASIEVILSNLSAVAACIRVRSEMLASVGLHVYQRGADGARERADDNPLYDVLHNVANPTQTAFEFRELLIRDHDLTGNGFAFIERDGAGQVVALFRLDPQTVTVEKLTTGRLRYKMSGKTYLQDEILHIRGPSRDGVLGQSPLVTSRGVYSLALAQTETAASVAQNAVRASGVMTFETKLGADARKAIGEGLLAFTKGGERSGSILLMDNNAKFSPIDLSAADMEFLASRKLANEDCCRIFGIPPTVIGITGNATYSNSETEGRALVQNALGPLATRIEQAMMRCLLSAEERKTIYIEHDLAGLLRGDVQARFEAYRIAREIGVFSPNDVRKKENEAPIANGDTYHYPGNWVPLGTVAGPTGEAA